MMTARCRVQALTGIYSLLTFSIIATPTAGWISPDYAPAAAANHRRAEYPGMNVAGMVAVAFFSSVVGASAFVCVIYAIMRCRKRRNKQKAMEEEASWCTEDAEQVECPMTEEEMRQLRRESLPPSYDEVAAVPQGAHVCR